MEDAAATGEGFKPLVLKRRIKTDWALLDHVQAAPTATATAASAASAASTAPAAPAAPIEQYRPGWLLHVQRDGGMGGQGHRCSGVC